MNNVVDKDLLIETYGSFRDSSLDQPNVSNIYPSTGENAAADAVFPVRVEGNGVNSRGVEDTDEDQDVLPLWRKLAYGAGGPPMQMLSNSMAFFFTVFLLETAQVDAYYNSVIQFSARAWDAITDPLVGYFVTRTRTRWGRMRPWLISSAPFGAVTFFLLFYVPDISSNSTKFAYYFLSILALQTTLTTFHVPYSSMTMVLTSNMKERDSCSAFRMGFELLGVLIGVGVFGTIINQHRSSAICEMEPYNQSNVTNSDRELQKVDYMIGSGIIGGLFVICALIAFFGTQEKNIVIEKQENYLRSIRRILSFPPYLKLMFAFLFISLGLQTVQGNLALYITHSMELPGHMNYGILTLLVAAILFIPCAQAIILRFGKKTTFAVGVINMFPMLIVMAFIPAKPHLAIFYAVSIVCGFTVSISFLLPWSMLPDVIDAFMLKNGIRLEAAFYSFYVFFNKFAVGISVGTSSLILGFVGYKVDSNCQDPVVALALRFLIGPTAIVFFIISLIFLYSYPINEKYRARMRFQLECLKTEQERLNLDQSSQTLVSSVDCRQHETTSDWTGVVPRKETIDLARKYTANGSSVPVSTQLSTTNDSTCL